MSNEQLINPFKDKNLMLCLGLVVFIQLGISSIIPVLPLMGTELGLSVGRVSMIVAAYTLPSIFLAPFAGYLVDRFGRKEVLMPSILLYSIAGTACAFATSVTMLIWLRLLQGIGVVTFDVLFATIIGDLYSGKERVRNMGYITTTFSICTAILPLLGGALALIHWRLPFILPAFGFLYAFIAFKHLTIPKPAQKPALGNYMRGIKEAIFLNKAVVVYAMTLLGSVGTFGAFQIYFPKLIASQFLGTPLGIGIFLTLSAVVSAIVSTQLVLINKVLSKHTMLFTAFVLYVLSMASVPFIDSLYWLCLPMVLNGIAQGMAYSMMLTVLSDTSGKRQRGAVMAINASMLTLGQSVAPFVLLLPYTYGGFNWTFGIGALFMAACAYLVRHLKKHPTIIR